MSFSSNGVILSTKACHLVTLSPMSLSLQHLFLFLLFILHCRMHVKISDKQMTYYMHWDTKSIYLRIFILGGLLPFLSLTCIYLYSNWMYIHLRYLHVIFFLSREKEHASSRFEVSIKHRSRIKISHSLYNEYINARETNRKSGALCKRLSLSRLFG